MSCSSAIYAINQVSTAVTANNIIPLTSVIRKTGCGLRNYNNGIDITNTGYYLVNASVSLSTASAGTLSVSIFKDGVQVPGAIATTATTASQLTTVSITCIVRKTCCSEPTTLTLVPSLDATVANAAITVQKI